MSEARVNLLSNRLGTGPAELRGQWAARSYLNLNGTGTIVIRKSGNISSVIDGGTGTYTQNFTTAFNATDYATIATAEDALGANAIPQGNSTVRATNSHQYINVTTNTRGLVDVLHEMISTFGDLA